MSDAGAGWHPDPAGRFEHRWWDGQGWTDQVSTAGVTQVDPQGHTVPEPDLSLLERPGLAVEFSGTGLERDGAWGLFAPDYTTRLGRVVIERGGLVAKAWYEVQDANQRPIIRVDQLSNVQAELQVRDHVAAEIGRLQIRGSNITLMAPVPDAPAGGLAAWGSAQVEGLTYAVVSGFAPGGQPTPTHAQIQNSAGQPVGIIRVFDEGGGRPSWFVLERDPEMPEPMRSLVVALIPALGWLTAETRLARAAARRRQRLD
jgi:hypothetical protein